jgi:hypothetical protein
VCDRAVDCQAEIDAINHNIHMALHIPLVALLPVLWLPGAVSETAQSAPIGGAVEMPADYGQSVKPLVIPAPSRGQLFYENHCLACHESVVHIRERHKVRTMDDLRAWVELWAGELHLNWGPAEMEEVVRHLNHRHYHFEER